MQVGHLGKEARWGEATYENEYVKQDGVWKISKLHGFITYYVEFDKGLEQGRGGPAPETGEPGSGRAANK